MKILTLNCHSWQEKNQLEKIKYIAKTINERRYDIIALQEVSQSIDSKFVFKNIKKDNFALVIQDELKKLGNNDYEFIWDLSHIGYDIYEEGLCIMTKLPILSNESFYITSSQDINNWKSRKIVKAKLKYNEKDINFYSCHLGWWKDDEESFTSQVDCLISRLNEDDGVSFIMGDFNNDAKKRDEGYDYILSRGLKDTYSLAKNKDNGITVKGNIAGWDKNREELRLDMIFSNKDIYVKDSSVIFNDKNKDIVSDHYGVEVNINI